MMAGKYPAKLHVQKLLSWMKERRSQIEGLIYIEGQKTRLIEDNDGEAPFRQRRSFYYLTGCDLPDSSYAYNIESNKSTLFIPPVSPESVIWSGLPTSPTEALSLYDVDEVLTTDKIDEFLSQTNLKSLWTIANHLSDQRGTQGFHHKDFTFLKTAIEECRVVKDEFEIGLMKKANAISAIAHRAVFDAVKDSSNERDLLAIFLKTCISQGAKDQAYSPIVASGKSAATLHYVKNDQEFTGKLNILLDAGAEYNCYASDITRTFPISGTFSPESKSIYNIVLKMQVSCIKMIKEGISWDDAHLVAHEVAIEGLLELGILQGTKEAILQARTSVAFFPHGLGHYLGMDTHDTGGHPNYNDKDPIFKYLRVRGRLPAGAVVTVEPGIYFCPFIIDPYLKDPIHAAYINPNVLEKYWDVGGVRIEDNILVTKTGYENFTSVEKSIEDIERLLAKI